MKLFGKKMCILRTAVMLLMLLFTVAASAVPAKPGLKKMITLTDGTTVSATLVGDEYGHYWLGADGKAYQGIGGDVYQSIDVAAVKQRAAVRRNAANQHRARRLAQRKVGDVGSITGQKKCVIILVNFKNKSFTATQSDFNKLANQVNYNSGNYKGSMYDYFYAQSDGQFQLTFDVVGPYTLSQNYAYYGGNDSNGDDSNPGAMVKEAVQMANNDVNFADYDWDNDGYVDQVYVVYAGKGEADGGSDDTIWPHAWDLSSATGSYITLDGKKINSYACGGEQNGETGATAGIGTMCHEFSHCLGYPDFYDTDYSGGQGMFMWDLMDSGSYNGDGYRPAGYTSYERWVAGWKTPTELTATQTVSNMKALQDTGSDTYIIYNKGNNNEYYLLENRQKKGWDTDLPGAGLLILHVDYSSSAWANNTPNDTPSHQRMTWIPADNKYQYTTYQGTKYYTEEGAANDPFPYGSVNAFGKNTTPAAKLYNANNDGTYYLDSSVENITQNSNGTITFNFVGTSNVATPTFSPAAGRYENAQTVTISCETTGATIRYTLDGTTPTTSSTVYSSPLTISETTTVKAIAIKDGDQSAVASAKYTIGAANSDPNTTTFKLVTSTDDLEDGLRYVIACGSKAMAAGAMGSGTYLSNVSVNVSSDVITITDNVAVFVLEQGTNGWTFKNEDTNEYLDCTAAKNVSYSSSAAEWTLSNGTDGVIMTMGDYGTMLYNSTSPRFTTYTSSPTTAMIQANLYVEDSGSTPVVPDPLILADETVTFSTAVGTSQTKTFEVLSEGLTEDITVTLTTNPSNVFSLGSSTISRTASELGATGSVTFTPTAAGTYTGTITLTSAGADPVTINLTATATEASTSETLFYEGLSEYSGNDGTQAISTSYQYLDYNSWSTLTNIYVGGTGNAYDNGGCLKFGKRDAAGAMTTGSLALTGTGTLTFYLRQYGGDTGKLNVTVSGATADVTEFTPSSDWTLCTVNLTDATGTVTITLATSSKRAYVDEITLTSGSGTTPVQKEDVEMSFNPSSVEITQGDTFTKPTLTTDPAGLAVTYSSSDESVATVDPSTGDVTIVGTGTTTITATFAGDDDYNEGSASYELTVNTEVPPTTVPTLAVDENSITNTTADVSWTACDGVSSYTLQLASDDQFTTGGSGQEVTLIENAATSPDTPTGWTYNIDNRSNSYIILTNGHYVDTEAFNASGCVDLTLSLYMRTYGGTTYPSVTVQYSTDNGGTWSESLGTLSAANTTMAQRTLDISDAAGYASVRLRIASTSTNNVGVGIKNIVITGTESGGSGSLISTITVTGTSYTFSDLSPETTYYARVTGEDDWSNIVTFTTEATASAGDKYELVTDASTLAADDEILIAYVNENDVLVLSTTQNNNNRAATTDVTLNNDGTLTPGGTAQIITLEEEDDNFLFNVGNGYLYAASSTGNQMKTQYPATTNAQATIEIDNDGFAMIEFQGSNTRNIMRYNPNNGAPIFSCYAESSTAGSLPQIYRKVVPVAYVTLDETSGTAPTAADNVTVILNRTLVGKDDVESGHAWNTICFPFALSSDQIQEVFGDGTVVKALAGVTMKGERASLSFEPVDDIVANTPYIMQVEEGGSQYTIEGIEIDPSDDLTVTVGDIAFIGNYTYDASVLKIPAGDYYLLNDEFRKSTNGTVLKGFRAYFHVAAAGIKSLGFEEDEATGIDEIENSTLSFDNDTEVYDLAGRRVARPSKGLYIINGKKVFVK